MKLKFTLFIFLCLCGGGWYFYNQNKAEIQELVKAGQELNQIAQENQATKIYCFLTFLSVSTYAAKQTKAVEEFDIFSVTSGPEESMDTSD